MTEVCQIKPLTPTVPKKQIARKYLVIIVVTITIHMFYIAGQSRSEKVIIKKILD